MAALAYLIGSVPTGALVARYYGNVDLTQVGSARTGAANATRTLGLGAGLVVFAGDWAKGFLAVALARLLIGTPGAEGLAWFVAVIGHTRSPFLRWRGGRGVGTGLGGLALAAPLLFILGALSGATIAATTRYISLGSICGCLVAFGAGMGTYATGSLPLELVPFLVATASTIILAHTDNIARLRAGTERRVGQREAAPSSSR